MIEKIEKNCFVHNKKSLSKFHSIINEIYRLNQFDKGIIQKLPKLCCNCQQTNQESSIDFDYLYKLCQQIQSQPQQNIPTIHCKQKIPHLILQYPPLLTSKQRIYKVGQFIGRKGRNIRNIQSKLNVSLKIINTKSSQSTRKFLSQIEDFHKYNPLNDICIFIDSNTGTDSIKTIKQILRDEWDRIDVSVKAKHEKIKGKHGTSSIVLEHEKDSRWKPKQSKQKTKSKAKRNQHEQHPSAPHQPTRPFFRRQK